MSVLQKGEPGVYCPECGSEYREGFFTCTDCGVALVAEPPPEVPESEPVTVLESGDPNEIAFAEATLSDAGIPYVETGHVLQNLFAGGRLGFRVNPLGGPVTLQVPKEHAAKAVRFLEGEARRIRDAAESAEPQEASEPQAPTEAPGASLGDRRLRLCELALVVGVGFLASTVASLIYWWTGQYSPPADNVYLYSILQDVLTISLLAYVLYRQGRSLKSIGLTARFSDLGWALLLLFFSGLVSRAIGQALPPAPASGHRALLNPGLFAWLAIVPGAAREELVVRAYLMTEVGELTGHMGIAVLASVGFQTLYHLYQGTSAALVSAGWFFVASLFYASTRRATPLIIAHALYNFWVFSQWNS
jgi:hypothetical protein